jgi:hypothetical protein
MGKNGYEAGTRQQVVRGLVQQDFMKTKAADPAGKNADTTKAGRPPGSKNIQSEARTFALEILRSPEYRKSLMDRVKAGSLASNIEAMLWAYAYGRPTERMEVTHVNPTAQLAEMSIDELAKRAELIASVLKEVGDIEAAEYAMKMADKAQEERNLQAIDATIVARVDSESTIQ